ncbi:DUF3274 domain-containing protein [Rugamonas sp. CCM 8940]|uniref:T6SS effector phospholipase Tle3 domain-containing protein n=1 Tax=Rugamonas sp. CCM 8940 TaxID=2765359 RepID=UPI0018F2BCB1|nr:DUF3274 domain-containing protein [Rugamonas sp. CCM 8940]MBJ7312352.1 DUF3274 domain-containing protein [Rugamonas sp. CCM 8940]
MWNRGFGSPGDIGGDALRPLVDGPGRLYMVLAASRLAALISMIRDYHEDETVTVVAHSQGCMLTLLAQAMLAEKGLRPADTLVLTHPPYSLVDTVQSSVTKGARYLTGGVDEAMRPHYAAIDGMQSLHARLQTLVNIVRRVVERKPSAGEPKFATLAEHKLHDGIVGGLWKAELDRDNRGKVYLYFCPQDMTVALDNIQGIGWQGVPDFIEGTQWAMAPEKIYDPRSGGFVPTGRQTLQAAKTTRQALNELGRGFYQRVFTSKLRTAPTTDARGPVLVGSAPPYDYLLRLKGEDDHAHVEESGRALRAHFPVATWPAYSRAKPAEQRNGIRTITGEALRVPVEAVLSGAAETAPQNVPPNSAHAKRKLEDRGPCEDVDPLDAAIAVTSDVGMRTGFEERPDPRAGQETFDNDTQDKRSEPVSRHEIDKMTRAYNEEKGRQGDDQRTILNASYIGDKFIATVEESPNEGRLRWQHGLSAKSFHGAIIGNKENHKRVTAYDIAIGRGRAATDPMFYAYLCAVADWRLRKPSATFTQRPGILTWDKFLLQHNEHWGVEIPWRRELIEGNSNYYSTGELPPCVPLLTGALWEIVIAETVGGNRVDKNKKAKS